MRANKKNNISTIISTGVVHTGVFLFKDRAQPPVHANQLSLKRRKGGYKGKNELFKNLVPEEIAYMVANQFPPQHSTEVQFVGDTFDQNPRWAAQPNMQWSREHQDPDAPNNRSRGNKSGRMVST